MRMSEAEILSSSDVYLEAFLKDTETPAIQKVLADPDEHRFQMLYVQIDRDAHNSPCFREFPYRLDEDEYFYPASTVKLPIVLAALEKIRETAIPELSLHTPMHTGSDPWGSPPVWKDSSSENGEPSIAHYIKKILMVSDNDAANRLYEFVGQRELNQRLHDRGFQKTDILHRLDSPLSTEQHRYTPAVSFVQNGHVIHWQPEAYNPDPFPLRHECLGRAFETNGHLVPGPMDFSKKNRAPLRELVHLLQSIIFPASTPKERRFNLLEEDYLFLYRYLSEFPTESRYPRYDPALYPPAYAKFLLWGGDRPALIPPGIRLFGKSGWAYGFLTDVVYLSDFENRVEFLLAATLQVNKDGILQDDHYQYETLGKPFLKELGEAIYRHELKRPRKYLPDLSRYSLSYPD